MNASKIVIAAMLTMGLGTLNAEVENALRLIGKESKTASFNDSIVEHAKNLYNSNFHKMFSSDGSDFVDFWHMANEVNLNYEQSYTCLRLFKRGITKLEVIDNPVTEMVVASFPSLFERQLEVRDNPLQNFNIDYKNLQNNLEDMFLNKFTTGLDDFRAKPGEFLTGLSNDVVSLVRRNLSAVVQENEEKEFKVKLRGMATNFLETMLSKTIWYPDSGKNAWISFVAVADGLHTLGERGIVDEQDKLDELWDVHMNRFIWFLDGFGTYLPQEFFDAAGKDLSDNKVFFLTVEEQDRGVRAKKDDLMQALGEAQIKSLAMQKANSLPTTSNH